VLFRSRDISFFNSQYLEEDSYIPKEGNYSQPGVTNYFNARINVKQALDSSRYSLNVEFTAAPHLITLVAGEIITLTKYSYGWDRKEFRISKLVLAKDGTIKVTATEHTDQTYCLTAENTRNKDSLLSSALPNTSNSQAFKGEQMSNYNINIDQGATFTLSLTIKENNAPKNLTNYTGVEGSLGLKKSPPMQSS